MENRLQFRYRITFVARDSEVPGSIPGRYQIFCEVVSLERGPLGLVKINGELFEWNNSGCGFWKPRLTTVGIRRADHATASSRESWH
jgi:hypothetical protein